MSLSAPELAVEAAAVAEADDVAMRLEIDGVDGALLGVQAADLSEEMSEVSLAVLEVRCDGALPQPREMLHLDCSLSIERGSQTRGFRGVIQHASLQEDVEGSLLTLHVAPAMAYLRWIVDTRVYQGLTCLEVVQGVFDEKLGGRSRRIRNECQRACVVHEYIVQYDESCLAFVERLLEREGIFYYFDHEGEHEILVLADAVASCQTLRPGDGGEVPFAELAQQAPEHEAITFAAHSERIGTTDAVVAGRDWTNPDLDIRVPRIGRGPSKPALERYSHGAALHHDYRNGRYHSNTAEKHAQMCAARLDQERERWRLGGTVITAQPGRVVTVRGSLDPDVDGRFLILQTSTHVVATGGAGGSISQSMEVHPYDRPYVPPRRTPVPVVRGVESATVVGPRDQEIHTDEHGRIKVQFPWDRNGDRSEHSSCWIRVAQMWGGAGWGTLFTPRIGMEVIVSFLGGDPDRPIVIGSLYNGTHPPPYVPDGGPGSQTVSTIRTNSTPGSEGFNELRFDDAAGSEEVFLRAQMDLNELVRNDHHTQVLGDRANDVGGNQSVTVGLDRSLAVAQDETINIGGARSETVAGPESIRLLGTRVTEISKSDTLVVNDAQEITVAAHHSGTYRGGREVVVENGDAETVSSSNKRVTVDGAFDVDVTDRFRILRDGSQLLVAEPIELSSPARAVVQVGGNHVTLESGGTVTLSATSELVLQCGSAKITLKSDGSVEVSGSSKVDLVSGGTSIGSSPSGVAVSGTQIDVTGSGPVSIVGSMVKVN